MPSIEIICIGQASPRDFSRLPFAVDSSTELRSHRIPKPLFQGDFSLLSGCIYHLGSPYLKDPKARGPFFAYELLSERSRADATILEFAPEFVSSVRELLVTLMDASPESRLLFTTDWQFGPKRARRLPKVSLSEFWRLHDLGKLRLNSAYPLQGA